MKRLIAGLLLGTMVISALSCTRTDELPMMEEGYSETIVGNFDSQMPDDSVVSLQEQLENSSTTNLIREMREIERTDCVDKAITPEQCASRLMRREEILASRCESGHDKLACSEVTDDIENRTINRLYREARVLNAQCVVERRGVSGSPSCDKAIEAEEQLGARNYCIDWRSEEQLVNCAVMEFEKTKG